MSYSLRVISPRIDPFRDHLRDIAIMREVHRSQFQLGQVPIEEIWINPKSRDDIPAVLKGLQHIWCDEELRERLFALLDEHNSSGGRPHGRASGNGAVADSGAWGPEAGAWVATSTVFMN